LDRSVAIRDAENEFRNISEELKILRDKEADLVRKHRQYKIYWNKANKDFKETQVIIRNIDTTIEEIKTEAEEAENITTDTNDLEDDVRQAEEAYELLQVKKEENKKAIEELLPQVDDVKNRIVEISARNEKISDDINQTEMLWNNYMRGLSEKKRIMEKKRTQVEQAEAARDQQLENIKSRVESRNIARLKAQQVTFTNSKAKEERSREKNPGQKEKTRNDYHKVCSKVKNESHQSIEEQYVDFDDIEPILTEKDSMFYKNKILHKFIYFD
jgi:chromosome segregation ATPase